MYLSSVTLRVISMPLKSPFQTHLETVREREVIVVEVRDLEGTIGYGEAVPFSSPWYTEETIKTVFHMLEDFLIPLTLKKEWHHPSELSQLWSGIRRNQMAKSALEQAIWDLYAKQQGVYLGTLMGGERTEVAAGVVIATSSVNEALNQIEMYAKEGYQRYKVKINRTNDIQLLSEIRKVYPDLPLMIDANSAYTLDDVEHLQRFDQFKLLMIEQPLRFDDIVEHSYLQKELQTPICLDESICSFHDAKSALLLESGRILNIKMARVGGWTEAVRIHDLCVKANIPLWCGGMIEFGISRAHNVALASLKGFTIPGDLSSSSKYWEQDIIEPEIQVVNGMIPVPKTAGIGFAVKEKYLHTLTQYEKIYRN